MGDKRVVWIFTGSRSERGLLNPIIKRCEASPLLETHVVKIDPRRSLSSIVQTVESEIVFEGVPDVALIPCMPAGTIIPCYDTMKDISEVRVGDNVLSHDGKYHRVINVSTRIYEGKLVTVKSRLFPSITLTPEHPIYSIRLGSNPVGWCRYHNILNKKLIPQWILASQLKKGDLVAHPIIQETRTTDIIDFTEIYGFHPNLKKIPTKIKISSNLLKSLGLFVAEGSAKDRQIVYSFGNHESNLIEFIKTQFQDNFRLEGKEYDSTGHSTQLEFNSSGLSRVFASWFGKGAENKKVPRWILELPKEKIPPFIHGLFLGDGWKVDSKRDGKVYKFSTVSRILSYSVVQLLNKCGVIASIHKVRNNPKAFGTRSHRYEVSITGIEAYKLSKLFSDGFVDTFNRKIKPRESGFVYEDSVWTSITDVKQFDFKGPVYNLEVEQSNSYIANLTATHNCDRREMVPVAMTCFFARIPTVHYLGGVFSYSATFDDVSRHVISLFSHIICVESEAAKQILVKSGEAPWRIQVTGTSHFDDVEICEDAARLAINGTICFEDPEIFGSHYEVLSKPYDLVLINSVHEQQSSSTLDNYKQTRREVEAALEQIENYAVLIGPNEDDGGKIIRNMLLKYYRKHVEFCTYFPDGLTRSNFLGLLKNCRRFVSNSSATLYEAPRFGVEVLNPSIRNSERTPPDQNLLSGGSDKVVKLLCELDLKNPKLLAKRVRSPEWQKSIQLRK